MTGTPRIPSRLPSGASGRTDLGRRLAARREALGLTPEELGRRCAMDAHYVTYLEEHEAAPSAGTLVRIADALGTTVGALTGASADRAPGRATARRDPELVALDEPECRRLLGTHGVGRLAVFTSEGPSVVPVNYLVVGAAIAFRTAEETVAARARGTEAAFEIDHIDEVTAEGWSVLAVGALEAVTDGDEQRHLAATARSRPWPGGSHVHWMKLTPVRLTGRRVVHD
ncbi:pyridoxamine 5'-phosphate oxidase family protein [Streptomyces bambusae]|uniref:helix-turn-helix domain-containing protein n=1 Tax=Streptomyces bambusae TaxID=1550616 RepID=UPI001CFC9236|nr:pyridoxamine 5'-phosphate oxidase family protein [Streptomyces bambusae]MCB5163866.1 pyridoxamine 5'-phosphate oxidase family protein [Streptomyces bambusae]